MGTTDPKQHRYVPSGFVMTHVVNPITIRLGGPTLTVRGRRSGRPIITPVPRLAYEGARHFVSGAVRPTGCGTCGPPARASSDEAVSTRPSGRSRCMATCTTGS